MFHKNLTGQNLHIARSNAGVGSPVGVVTPTILGELWWDTLAKQLWVSTGTGINDWIIACSGSSNYTSEIIPVVNSQLIYQLSQTPNITQATQIFLTGTKLIYNVDFTVSGDEVTLIPASLGYNPDDSMVMEVLYI